MYAPNYDIADDIFLPRFSHSTDNTIITVGGNSIIFYSIVVPYPRVFTQIVMGFDHLGSTNTDSFTRLGIYELNKTTGGPGIKLADVEVSTDLGVPVIGAINVFLDAGLYYVCFWNNIIDDSSPREAKGSPSNSPTGGGVSFTSVTSGGFFPSTEYINRSVVALSRSLMYIGQPLPEDESAQTHSLVLGGAPVMIGIR